MVASEAKRHDLYTGLNEVLGPDRAETLMTYLPAQPATDLATRPDIGRLEARMDRFEDALRDVNQRLDRLFLTMLAGLVAIIGTLIASLFL